MKHDITNRKKREAASRPEEPGLDVPVGGGNPDTPYPDFDVVGEDKWAYDWDDKTRNLVLDRVRNVPPYRFFSEGEVALLEALCERALPQDGRSTQQRVPIAPWINERLHQEEGDGYRYEDMPEDREAYRRGLQGFDQTAQALFQKGFTQLTIDEQARVMACVAEGKPPGEVWKKLPASRFFTLFLRDVITNYYAHPAAWAEIGFSGPASPRGHIRLGLGKRDPWEAEEKRPRSSVEIVRRNAGKGGQKSGEATH
jgi:Gluconate 2-dehydrogenase subunit 3